VREGWLADLLLVDGDPLANLSILRDPKRILAVMKDGGSRRRRDRASQRRWERAA
jgi:imidazolonepropionase-like amidohydrolase